MKVIRAQTPEDLGAILDYVHDRPYVLAGLDLNARERTVMIPVRLRSRRKGERSWFRPFGRALETKGSLVVRSALSYRVVDNAKIGEGDINTIQFHGKQLHIKGSIPVDITVEVETLDVELLVPEDAA